ncbi:MAG: ABC transporter substrate-binding protein [Acidobacteriota bacterium]|nr:ABC transporter substrate-binding protein [Acidobacteriota bacterium]
MSRRAVSLVPSITETLLAWGVVPVGVTRFCETEGIALVGGTKNPDIEAIKALAPDVVLMDEEENRAPDAARLAAEGIPVVATAVRSVGDVGPALAVLADAVGVAADPALGVVADPALGVAADPALGAAADPATNREDPPPTGSEATPSGALTRVFVPIWRRPWMTVSEATYGSSLLRAAGFENIFADAADPYPTVELDEAARRRPDLVLAPSEPYAFAERHRRELEQVGPVAFVDGRDLFWWGSRTAGALGRLREMANELGVG